VKYHWWEPETLKLTLNSVLDRRLESAMSTVEKKQEMDVHIVRNVFN
jgi:hypothetical protein